MTDELWYECARHLTLVAAAVGLATMCGVPGGLLLGCAMRRYKMASSAALSILLGTYFLSVASALDKDLDFLKYFSPFKYFDPALLLHESRFDAVFVVLSLGVIVACMAGAYVTYARRELYI